MKSPVQEFYSSIINNKIDNLDNYIYRFKRELDTELENIKYIIENEEVRKEIYEYQMKLIDISKDVYEVLKQYKIK